jgi:hypothetical protein
MIDTDKYEGHTPAPWTITEDMQSVMIPANHQSVDDMSPYIGSGANAQLIADAPLLLEEIKRLRKRLEAFDCMRFDIEHAIDHSWASWEDLKVFLKEMIK